MAEYSDEFTVGTAFKQTAMFVAAGEANPADPSQVKVRIRRPTGQVIDLVYGQDNEVERDDIGVYHVRYIPDAPGTWWIDWVSTGLVDSVEETALKVRPLAVPA